MKLGASALAALVVAAPFPDEADFRAVAGNRWLDRAAQCWQESRFNARAENKISHAKGRFQFMDPTWKESQDRGVVPKTASPFDSHWALVAGHDYMNRQEAFSRKTLPGCDAWLGALVCYNWGAGNWRKAVRRAQATGADGSMAWVKYCPAESQNYIVVIPAKRNAYQIEVSDGH